MGGKKSLEVEHVRHNFGMSPYLAKKQVKVKSKALPSSLASRSFIKKLQIACEKNPTQFLPKKTIIRYSFLLLKKFKFKLNINWV